MSGPPLDKFFLEVTIMCGNNCFGGNNCWWIIILVLLFFCCGNNNNGYTCGNTYNTGCGCERTCC